MLVMGIHLGRRGGHVLKHASRNADDDIITSELLVMVEKPKRSWLGLLLLLGSYRIGAFALIEPANKRVDGRSQL